jgi:hypothetical protein
MIRRRSRSSWSRFTSRAYSAAWFTGVILDITGGAVLA